MHQLSPNGPFHRRWNILLFMAVLYNTTSIPLRLAFGIPWLESQLLFCDLIADAVYLLNIYIMYHTSYRDKGRLINSIRSIRTHYHNTRGPVDIASSFPLDWLVLFAASTISPLALALWRLPRLLQLLHFFHHFEVWEKNSHRSSSFFRLAKLLCSIIICTYFVGCGWAGVGLFEAASGSGSWLVVHGLIDSDISTQFLYAWYWAITTVTTVGYGDISPTTKLEVGFTIVAMLLGVSLWAYVIGNVASLVSNLDATRTSFRQKMDGVKQYMHYRKLPAELQQRVSHYYEFLWSEGKAMEDQSLFNDLPTGLRREISLYLNREIVERVPFFNGMDEGFVRSTVALLTPQVFCPSDTIITRGEVGHEMYFLTRGKVDVLSEDNKNTVHSYHSGDFFGEIALLFSEKRSATVVASTHCDIFVLTKEDLTRLFEYYPEFQKKLNQIGKERYEAAQVELQNV